MRATYQSELKGEGAMIWIRYTESERAKADRVMEDLGTRDYCQICEEEYGEHFIMTMSAPGILSLSDMKCDYREAKKY